MPTLKDVANFLGVQSERQMASKLGLHAPISTLALIQAFKQLPPKARFSVVPNSGTMPLAVVFTDQSLGYITAWDWKFDDGGTSSDRNPPHTYEKPKEEFGDNFDLLGCSAWTPTLTVSNKAGSDTASANVTVNPAPPVALNFTVNQTSGPAPLQVDFAVDRSAGYCLTHQWNFGDPASGSLNYATTSGQVGPYHKYKEPGTYNVVLEVTNSAGSSYAGTTITVTDGSESGSPPLDTPYITAGWDPAHQAQGVVLVSGDHFKASDQITITVTKAVTKQGDNPLLAQAPGHADSLGHLDITSVGSTPCTGGTYESKVYVQAIGEDGRKSNTVSLDCFTMESP